MDGWTGRENEERDRKSRNITDTHWGAGPWRLLVLFRTFWRKVHFHSLNWVEVQLGLDLRLWRSEMAE